MGRSRPARVPRDQGNGRLRSRLTFTGKSRNARGAHAMKDNELFDKGFENRKEVLGASHVEKSWANADDFNRPMQKLVTEYAWGEIWGDPTLPFKTRSMLNIAMLTAMSQHHEL